MNAKNAARDAWSLIMWIVRAAIVGFAGWYTIYNLAVRRQWDVIGNFAYLTQITMLLVFVYYVVWVVRALINGASRTGDRSGEVRGFITLLALMVGLVFNTMLGPVEGWPSTVSHIVVPVLVVVDWFLFGKGQGRIRAWMPFIWTLMLVPYLAFYWWFSNQPGHVAPYPFLTPGSPDFATAVVVLAVAFVAAGFVVYLTGQAIARVKKTPRTKG